MWRGAIIRGIGRAAAVLVLAVPVLTGCGDDDQARVAGGTLLVYGSFPLAGPSAAAGKDEAAGARLALAQARGRAGGERVRLRILDSAERGQPGTTPRQVAVNARTARRDKRTVAYIGETEPAASAVSLVILNVAGVLQVSPSDTFAGLTGPAGEAGEPDRYYPRQRRTFARVVPDDDLQARAVVRWMRELGRRRLLLLDDDRLYGRSLSERVGRLATRAGITVVDDRVADPSPARLRQTLLKVAPLKPDAVFLGAEDAPSARSSWDTLADALPQAARFGPGALDTPVFTSGAASGRLVAPGGIPVDRRFARAFRARYRRAPSLDAAFGHAAMRAVLDAIAAVPGAAPSRAEVVHAVHGLRVRRSGVGPFVIGAGGDSTLHGTAGVAIRGGVARMARTFTATR